MIFTILRQNNGKNRYTKVYRLCGLAAGLGVWQAAAVLIAQPLIVPKLEAIAAAAAVILTGGHFLPAVAATLSRIAATIVIDTIAAFVLGIAAGISERIEAVLSPFETAMRAVPTMGVLLLSLIWFNSEITPVFVASLIALPILYRGVVNGVKNIDGRLITMSSGFRVPLLRRLIKLYIPSIRPFTLTAYSAALGLLVKVMVTAEVLSQPQRGIGTEFQIARAQLDTATIFGWAIIVIILAALMERAVNGFLSLKISSALLRKTAEKNDALYPDENAAHRADDAVCPADNAALPANDAARLKTAYTDTIDVSNTGEPLDGGAAEIHIENISFGFKTVPVFESFSLDVTPARINYILGRSGKGKTTLLFLIAGFLRLQKGRIRVVPENAKIGFAYQDIRLIPHLTAEENIRYILPARYSGETARRVALYYLCLFGLQGFEHFLPAELSGGMQRRVGLARALAYPSEILLLDEAFDSLDPETKKAAAEVFSHIVKRQRRTVLCVTHDPAFAGIIADGIPLVV